MKDHLTLIELKRNLLIAELREALQTGADYHDGVVLMVLRPDRSDDCDDLAEHGVPWEALRLHYHILALRALEARIGGHLPNRATLRQRSETLQAKAGHKAD